MPEAATVIPVLDYAPPIPQRPLVRFARAAAWTLSFILGGALLGFSFAPTTYTAVGYFNVDATRTQSIHDRGIMQKAEIASILQYAPPVAAAGHSSPQQPLTPADIAKHLRVTPANEERLIEIAFESDDRDLARNVAQTIMTNYDTASPNVFIVAYPFVRTDHHFIYPITGAIVGLLVAQTFLSVSRRSRQTR